MVTVRIKLSTCQDGNMDRTGLLNGHVKLSTCQDGKWIAMNIKDISLKITSYKLNKYF